jgi:hypothetical protein
MSRFGSLILVFVTLLFAAFVAVPNDAAAQDASRISLDDEAEAEDGDIDIEEEDSAAQAADDDDWSYDSGNNSSSSEEPVASSGNEIVKGHGLQLAMSFVGVPGSIIDHWFKKHGNVWEGGAINMGFSLDYTLRFQAPCEMRFSLSWLNARTGSAYWLDKSYADRPHLADYIVNNYSIISLEVAAYHVISIIDEIAFYYGGGIWGGLVLDDAKGYAIRASCAETADDISSCPHEAGSVPLTQMPPGFGFVMVTLGFKFTLFDVMTIRAEGGFKGYFYGQLGLGVEF